MKQREFDWYRTMKIIRRFEEVIADAVENGEIICPVHLYIGQEAIAAGVNSQLRKDDYVLGGHRAHGLFIAKGGSLKGLASEIFGRANGCSGGRGGSMHLTDPEIGLLATVPIVAASIPLALGAAWSAKIQNQDKVAAVFFGDGACEEGVFHESLNWAALMKLPLIFVLENNQYSSHLHIDKRRPKVELFQMATAQGVPAEQVDGNDIFACAEATDRAVERARQGDGPTLLEFKTMRWRGHVGPKWDIGVGGRTQENIDQWIEKCPIEKLRKHLLGQQDDPQFQEVLNKIDEEVEVEVQSALNHARNSPYPEPSTLLEKVFSQ